MSLKLTFTYNDKGYGDLSIVQYNVVVRSWLARTGSINKQGKLINAIKPGNWSGREVPVGTNEIAMVVDGVGWKWRLWDPDGNWTHYLIHPDGNLPGSMGCIVLVNTAAIELRDRLRQYTMEYKVVPVEIRRT